jgi:hypothetical protein
LRPVVTEPGRDRVVILCTSATLAINVVGLVTAGLTLATVSRDKAVTVLVAAGLALATEDRESDVAGLVVTVLTLATVCRDKAGLVVTGLTLATVGRDGAGLVVTVLTLATVCRDKAGLVVTGLTLATVGLCDWRLLSMNPPRSEADRDGCTTKACELSGCDTYRVEGLSRGFVWWGGDYTPKN